MPQHLLTETIIIAAGTEKKWLGLPNEEALRGKGVVSATFCKDTDFSDKKVIVVGSGHAALQEAHYIADKAKEVIIVNRGNKFNASAFHQGEVFKNRKISIIYNTEVMDILDPQKNKVTEVVLSNRQTEDKTAMPVDIVLVAIGNAPNSVLFKDQLEILPTGQIVINGKNTSTNIPGVFAAGDITDMAYGRVAIASGSGAMAAMDVIRYLDSSKAP
ncbi:MAG: NAD(P)/FAD-dependent oxidoreductase [Parachlamydiaceae bacterium]